jgi:hypothetical protein
MTVTGAEPSAAGDAVSPQRSSRRQLIRRLKWWLAGLGALVVAAMIDLPIAAARYQPLTFGDALTMPVHSLPGLPLGQGITAVNTFAHFREDIYIPPQRGAFSLFVTVANNGTHSVTIASVKPPRFLKSAGQARYLASGLFSQGGRRV